MSSAATKTELVCPWCGTEAKSTYLLGVNHGVYLEREDEENVEGKPFYFPRAHGMCLGQWLTRNHLLFTARALVKGDSRLYEKGRSKKFDVEAARAALNDTIERARAMRLDPDPIIASVLMTTECKACIGGDHEACDEDLTWSSLALDTVMCACHLREHTAP